MSDGRRSHTSSRIGTPAVTPDFQITWREIEPALHASIRRWGIDAHAAADLTQDVAERAWRHSVEFTDAGDLLRWCRVVARNLIVDRYRRSGREVLATADAGTSESAEDVAVSQLEVERLVAAFSRLPASEQQAILSRSALPDTSAERVRRHRARARFARAIAAASAVAAWLGAATRRWRTPAVVAAAPSLVLVVALSGAIPFGDDAPGPDVPIVRDQAPPRAAATVVAPTRAAGAGARARAIHAPAAAPRAVPLPERHIVVPLPSGDAQSVRTYHDPAPRRAFCIQDQPVVGTFCTPF